jgi:hypothetical protein
MEKEIYILSYSFDQKCYHHETMERALHNNLHGALRQKPVSSFVPIAASYEESAICELSHDLGEVWNEREEKPTPLELIEIVKTLERFQNRLFPHDFSGLLKIL